jgi:hypothetical protein
MIWKYNISIHCKIKVSEKENILQFQITDIVFVDKILLNPVTHLVRSR